MTDTTSALQELLAQHAGLREMIERCERLADEVDASGGEIAPLTREVALLRLAFDAHNHSEEEVLRPVLERGRSIGPARIDAVVAEHVGEHRTVRRQLAGWTATSALREVLDHLRAHLDDEERYFLGACRLPVAVKRG